MNDPTFADYAACYDLLYQGKDYAAEAAWVDGVLRKNGVAGRDLLDIGCGTGAHAREFSRLGWSVTGIDASPQMIELARHRTPPGMPVAFAPGRAGDFSLGRKFSAAVSLFHVASYHTGPHELAGMLENVRRHLAVGGRLIFDFWHGPGVLADPPVYRERKAEGAGMRLRRTSSPTHHPDKNRVDVAYEVHLEKIPDGEPRRISEVHRMRYFFLPELETMLRAAGFAVESTHAGLSSAKLDDQAWYGLIVARAT